MVLPASDARADDYSRWNFGRVLLVPDVDAWVRHPVTKVISVAAPPLAETSLAAARAAFAGRADVTVSHPMFLEFLAPGVNKGRAMRYLARRLGVGLRETLAIGDQLNDLEMIAEAGTGVAMAGSPAEVRAAARVVAPPLAEEGAAQVLEDLVLGTGRPTGRGGPRDGDRRQPRDADGRMGENGRGRPPGDRQGGRSRR
jgi:hydroxymethylpyrimidine pyrophosphatase-like HAD family hydrolase